ncbi:hypothetical protein K474DRAFT_1391773 [Panus rudis PR-1116 ss-1]|nr:hypothetical protein K474DRAFT_1391773 [Panus rudis PR-1116 ss-1]
MASLDDVPACLLATVPVVQPPHLDGDPNLATEILPGPPSLQSVQQAGGARKETKKTGPAFSYLPVSDPGTTYGGHMAGPAMATATNDVDGPRRKRARLDKSSGSTRAQRASARNLTSTAPPDTAAALEPTASSSQLIPELDPLAANLDSDDLAMSRANSEPGVDDGSSATPNKRLRRDKGKGKEKETTMRIKEEPTTMGLGLQDAPSSFPNEDHCSACRSFGALVYCDGCPRAYHLQCLNPPLESFELPEGNAQWFCPACIRKKRPPPKPPASLKFMAPLLSQLQSTTPVEFQLPQDIRTFFKDVATGTRGTYVDSSEVKQPRLNRHGQLEEREPYRLKDRNGDPVLCFKCGTSALPPAGTAVAPAAKRARRSTSVLAERTSNTETGGRMIISCDYCHLHWHLDCVDPPMAYMPPWGRKWMCPNHAEQTYKPKRRVPRQNVAPIEITKPGQWNNGNIEVIQPQDSPILRTDIKVDEVLINGRRYRVPERIITMDFWDRAKGRERPEPPMEAPIESAVSSPLTELSSLPDIDDISPQPSLEAGLFNMEELKAALFLCQLNSLSGPSTGGKSVAPLQLVEQPVIEEGVQTETSTDVYISAPPKRGAKSNGMAAKVVSPVVIFCCFSPVPMFYRRLSRSLPSVRQDRTLCVLRGLVQQDSLQTLVNPP